MSKSTSSPQQNDFTPWTELTQGRQRVVKTIAHVHGPSKFDRPQLREDVEASSTVGTVIDHKDRVLTSLKYTRLLNELVDDGYLVKEFQGGNNPIILDLEYDKNRDTLNAAPFGSASELHTIVAQVCDRENISRDLLDEVDNPFDFIEVQEKVNQAVGRIVLLPYADPSEYRFTKETYGLATEKAEEFREDNDN